MYDMLFTYKFKNVIVKCAIRDIKHVGVFWETAWCYSLSYDDMSYLIKKVFW